MARTAMMSLFLKSARGLAVLLLLLAAMTASPSFAAGWREEIGTFRIGMVVRPGADGKDFGVLEEAFSKVLTMPVEFVPHREYKTLIEAHVSSRIDYALYSTTAYALAFLLCECVEPLAAPVSRDGSTGFRSLLIVDPKKITEGSRLKGKRIGHLGKDSLSGWIIPQSAFREAGDLLAESGAILVKLEDIASLVAAYKEGEIYGFFGWTRHPDTGGDDRDPMASLSQLERRGVDEEDYNVVWLSEPFPFGPHAVRKNLDQEAKDLLVKFVTELLEKQPAVYEALEPTHDGGLRAAGLDDYSAAVNVIRSLTSQPEVK